MADTYTREEVNAAALKYFKGNELQANCFTDKYALRDKEGRFHELTPADMHRRLAREFARIEAKYPNPLTEDEIFSHLDGFRSIVPQGSPMFGIGNDYQLVSTSNCAVIAGPEDTMSSIFNTARDMANLYKRRFGVGTDLSGLRPEGANVNNAAITSTGAWSFADFYSFVTRMVGQSGRRGALMLTMDVRHPDIEKFITMKADLTKVTGANVSVKVSDDFMRAVHHDEDYVLHFPVGAPLWERQVERVVRARDIFDLISETACKTAEPGVLFWDNAQRNLPLHAYEAFRITSTNPCGEILLSPNDSCRLISIYLANFVRNPFTRNAYFDFVSFFDTVRVAMRLSDDLVDLELEKLTALREIADTQDEKDLLQKFIDACSQGRRTGLGTHGLGDTLARLGLKYDSPAGILAIDDIYGELKRAAYGESVQMAEERGPFPIWNWETEKNCEFFDRLPVGLVDRMSTIGRRNGALLTNAPTGTVSIMSENCSSGIEPVYLNSYNRRRKVMDDSAFDMQDELGDKWKNYTVYHSNLEFYKTLAQQGKIDNHGPLTGRSFEDIPTPDYFVTSADIDPLKRVTVQGTIQQHVDHSLSSTINLVSTATAEDVGAIYLEAWKAGCKGVTVYRDGSRDAQVLSAIKEESPEPAETDAVQAEVESLRLTVGVLEDELAALRKEADNRTTSRGLATAGKQYKAAFRDLEGGERKTYVYVGVNEEGEVVEVFIEDTKAGKEVSAYAEALGITISLALKFGVPADEIAYKLKGIEGGSISYSGGIFKSVPDLVAKRIFAALDEQEVATFHDTTPVETVNDGYIPEARITMSAGMLGTPTVTVPANPVPTGEKMDRCDSCGTMSVPRRGRAGKCPPCTHCGFSKCG